MLLDLLDVRRCYAICSLVLSSWCYVAWSSLPHATLLDLPCLIVLDVFFTTLFFLVLSSCFYAARSSLHQATLLAFSKVMFCCLVFSVLCSATRSCLHDARLLDLIYFMLRCFTLPTSCQTAWCRVHQVMLFHLFFMMLGCLVFSISCYAAGPSHLISRCLMSPKSRYPFCFFPSCCIFWSDPPHATLLHHPPYLLLLGVFDIRSLIFDSLILPWRCYTARPWLPHVLLPDVPYIRLCFLIWSAWC